MRLSSTWREPEDVSDFSLELFVMVPFGTYVALFKFAHEEARQEPTGFVGVTNILESLCCIFAYNGDVLNDIRGQRNLEYAPPSLIITSSPPGC